MSKRRLSKRQQSRIAENQRRELSEKLGQADAADTTSKNKCNGRIISHFGQQLDVESLDSAHAGKIIRCHQRANLPTLVTGDRVLWELDGSDTGVILALGERRNLFGRPSAAGNFRPVAANIDLVLVIISPLPPPFMNLIDRYLVAIECLGLEPLLVLNKIDMLDSGDPSELDNMLSVYASIGYGLHRVSALDGSGIDQLEASLSGKTTVLVGQSGVGKSSLINRFGLDAIAVVGPLSNGKAKPSGQVIQDVGGQGVRWPSGLDLEDVQCSLRVTPSAIRLAKITGRLADGRLTAEGMVDLTADPIESSFDVHLDDLALERVIVDLLPGAGEGRARELWDRFRPQGTFDARMRFRAVGDEIEPLVMQVEPNDIRIVIDDQSVLLSRTGGELTIGSGRVTCKDLTLELTSDGRREGVLVLDGSYGIADDAGDMRLEGSWTDGQFDSPLIIEVLNMIGAGDYADRYRGYQPSGTFDAAFSYASAQDDRPQTYTVTVGPRTVAVNIDGTP
ncbi:MAG: ribosome small subunit-dependent GTPase A, partial [Proteobacteria bacterium]|nr:ribosome small subunit-dependent GTPase A [Pseudomonadota bacterium]